MKRFLLCLLALIPFTLLGTGCGNGNASVTGTVKFADGSPLKAGIVTFDSGKVSGRGEIGPDGTFSIEGGLLPDSYKVTLGGDAMGSYDDPAPLVEKSYASYATTDIEQQVEAKGNEFEIVVRRP